MKVTNSWQSNAARRVVGYSVSAIIASLIYVIWITVSTAIGGLGTTHSDLPFELGVAFFFLFAGGFALTLLLMIVPWAIAVWAHSKMRWDGRFYFRESVPYLSSLSAARPHRSHQNHSGSRTRHFAKAL
jgi:uncharacterized Tic20 family protein